MHKHVYVSLSLALIVTSLLGFYAPLIIDQFNDAAFGSITILEVPPIVKALQEVQEKGVAMCIHGWKHEDWSAFTMSEAKETIEQCLLVFEEADLVSVAFLTPYVRYRMLPPSVQEGIESTGLATSLPRVITGSTVWGQYGDWWRNMTSFSDSRYEEEYNRMISDQPTTILIHAIEWNTFLKQLICDYLEQTDRPKVIVRMDDVEVNTPVQVVYEVAELIKYENVGLIAYGVIPSGTWRGGDPEIFGVSVNNIMRFYWVSFLVTAFFPLSFFSFWRFGSRNKKSDNPPDDPPLDNLHSTGRPSVSVIMPSYNEENNIAESIEAALNQDYDGDKEVIVINDGSTDRTAEIASKYPVKLINVETNIGKANALNIGIQRSKGDILIFSDSDSQIASNAVSELVRRLEERQDVGAIAGNVFINDVYGKNNLLKYFQMIEYRTEQEINRQLQSTSGNVLVCPGPLFAVRRHIVEKIMFSDRTVIEDADFTVNVLKSPSKVIREPEARVYTNAPTSLRGWFNQRKRWWYGNLQIWRTHKKWATRNPWTILTYSGFLISLFSLFMMLMLPYLFSTYDNIILVLLRGMAYVVTPVILFTLFSALFFIKEGKLLLMLPFYTLIYSTMKVLTVSYLYLRYLSGKGVTVIFGARTIKVT